MTSVGTGGDALRDLPKNESTDGRKGWTDGWTVEVE